MGYIARSRYVFECCIALYKSDTPRKKADEHHFQHR